MPVSRQEQRPAGQTLCKMTGMVSKWSCRLSARLGGSSELSAPPSSYIAFNTRTAVPCVPCFSITLVLDAGHEVAPDTGVHAEPERHAPGLHALWNLAIGIEVATIRTERLRLDVCDGSVQGDHLAFSDLAPGGERDVLDGGAKAGGRGLVQAEGLCGCLVQESPGR